MFHQTSERQPANRLPARAEKKFGEKIRRAKRSEQDVYIVCPSFGLAGSLFAG